MVTIDIIRRRLSAAGPALGLCVFAVALFSLPCYAQAAGSPCGNCPGDLNGDKVVNMSDLAIVAANWLRACGDALPVLVVTGQGLSENAAMVLAESLGVPSQQVGYENGVLVFVDPAGFQAVPTTEVTDPQLIQALIRDSADDDAPLSFEAIDFAALGKVKPYDPQRALALFQDALRQVGGLGEGATPQIDHTQFEALDLQGNLLLPAVQIDTRVSYNFAVGSIPVVGPGAQISASFDPEGRISQLIHSARTYSPGETVPIISPEEAALRCAELYPGRRVQIRPRLVYYTPPLELQKVRALLPCYECGGTTRSGADGIAELMDALIPATDDRKYVPQVALDVTAKGSLVTAAASVAGGAAPYSFEWLSSSTELPDFGADAALIEYNAVAREPGVYPETIKVIVTDENGVVVQALQTVLVTIEQGFVGGIGPLATGAEFGVERAVSDLGGPEQSGYVNRMDDEVIKRFNWTGASSWERDFKDNETWATGIDHLYTDAVDQAFYVGHGSGAGITFESSSDDGQIHYTDVVGAWGDLDCEWMVLLSCQVLKAEHGGKTWWQRWGPAFDGLHLLLGYQTNASANTQTATRFAQYQLGRNFGFTTITLPIRAAWCQAKKEAQPNDREAVVMGVIGPSGLSNYNDYFWSKGPVGPDLRGSNIRGYWRIVYK